MRILGYVHNMCIAGGVAGLATTTAATVVDPAAVADPAPSVVGVGTLAIIQLVITLLGVFAGWYDTWKKNQKQ